MTDRADCLAAASQRRRQRFMRRTSVSCSLILTFACSVISGINRLTPTSVPFSTTRSNLVADDNPSASARSNFGSPPFFTVLTIVHVTVRALADLISHICDMP